MLIKSISKLGNTHCLPLDKTMMDLLGVGKDSLLKINFDSDGSMIVKKVTKEEFDQFVAEKSEEVMSDQEPVLKKLAE